MTTALFLIVCSLLLAFAGSINPTVIFACALFATVYFLREFVLHVRCELQAEEINKKYGSIWSGSFLHITGLAFSFMQELQLMLYSSGEIGLETQYDSSCFFAKEEIKKIIPLRRQDIALLTKNKRKSRRAYELYPELASLKDCLLRYGQFRCDGLLIIQIYGQNAVDRNIVLRPLTKKSMLIVEREEVGTLLFRPGPAQAKLTVTHNKPTE